MQSKKWSPVAGWVLAGAPELTNLLNANGIECGSRRPDAGAGPVPPNYGAREVNGAEPPTFSAFSSLLEARLDWTWQVLRWGHCGRGYE